MRPYGSYRSPRRVSYDSEFGFPSGSEFYTSPVRSRVIYEERDAVGYSPPPRRFRGPPTRHIVREFDFDYPNSPDDYMDYSPELLTPPDRLFAPRVLAGAPDFVSPRRYAPPAAVATPPMAVQRPMQQPMRSALQRQVSAPNGLNSLNSLNQGLQQQLPQQQQQLLQQPLSQQLQHSQQPMSQLTSQLPQPLQQLPSQQLQQLQPQQLQQLQQLPQQLPLQQQFQQLQPQQLQPMQPMQQLQQLQQPLQQPLPQQMLPQQLQQQRMPGPLQSILKPQSNLASPQQLPQPQQASEQLQRSDITSQFRAQYPEQQIQTIQPKAAAPTVPNPPIDVEPEQFNLEKSQMIASQPIAQ